MKSWQPIGAIFTATVLQLGQNTYVHNGKRVFNQQRNSAYFSHILVQSSSGWYIAPRTQNPVVREHRVGSSPTSGTRKRTAKSSKVRTERRGSTITSGLFHTN